METLETIRTSLQQGEWVTSIDFKDAYFHIPTQDQSRKYLRLHIQDQTFQFKALPFGLSTAPMEFTVIAKEVKLMVIRKGIRIHQSHRDCLQYTRVLVEMCQDLGWMVNLEKSELEPKQVFNFVGYQFDLESSRVRPTPDRWQNPQGKILELLALPVCSVREFMSWIGLLTATEKQVHLGRLHMRPIQWHLKSNWRIPESSANLYRRIKRRVGRSLKRVHCQRKLVPTGKQATHKLSGAQSSFSSLKRVSRPMRGQNGSCSNRQHHGSSLYQQGRGYEVRPTVCPTMENLDLVFQKTSNSESQTHPRPLKYSGGQTVKTRSDHPNRIVPPSRGFSSPVQQVAPTSNRSVCYKIQQQVAPVCITSSGSHGHCSGHTQFVMGESGRVRLPTDSHIGQSGGEVTGLPIPKVDHYCPRVAQHDMVLGPSGNVQSDPITLASTAKPTDPTLQSGPSQESDKPKSPCMAPQRGSTRSVYEAKWAIFTKWCITNQVDFRAPPVKSVADFLMYLLRRGNYSPAPLMATGLPLLINWEIQSSTSAKMKISPVSWTVSTETDPRAEGVSPPGTYLWFCTSSQRLPLNQLRRPP